jgi:succinate dehydrogenase/fumarate reductase cytochrome b subunit
MMFPACTEHSWYTHAIAPKMEMWAIFTSELTAAYIHLLRMCTLLVYFLAYPMNQLVRSKRLQAANISQDSVMLCEVALWALHALTGIYLFLQSLHREDCNAKWSGIYRKPRQ